MEQIIWRVALPPTTVVHQLVKGKIPSGAMNLFTVTSTPVADDALKSSLYVLSAWDAGRGVLQWEVPLGTKANGYTDVAYDASRFLVTALTGNAIDVYTARGLKVLHWAPSQSSDPQIAAHTKAGKKLVLAQLVVPMFVAPDAADGAPSMGGGDDEASHIAVGCFSSSALGTKHSSPVAYYHPEALAAAGATCGATVVLSAVLPSKAAAKTAKPLSGGEVTVTAKIFAAMPDVSPDALRAALASRGAKAYAANDVLFGYAVTNGKHKLAVLNLASNAVTTMDLPAVGVKAATLVAASKDRDVLPVVVQCTGRVTGAKDGPACDAHLVVATNADAKSGGYALQPLLSCSGYGAAMGVEHHFLFGSVVAVFSCARTNPSASHNPACTADDTSDKEKYTGYAGVSSIKSSAMICAASTGMTVSTAVVANAHGQVQSRTIDVTVDEYFPQVANLVTTVGTEQVLVVFASGTTVLADADAGVSAARGYVEWERDEALARLRQAVVVDDTRTAGQHLPRSEAKAPSLQERLEMQSEELLGMAGDFADFVFHLPGAISAHAATGFGLLSAPRPPPIDVSEKGLGVDHLAVARRRAKKAEMSKGDRMKVARRFGFNKVIVGLTTKTVEASAGRPAAALGPVEETAEDAFSAARLKLVGLDSITGEEMWALQPALDAAAVLAPGEVVDPATDGIVFARLVTLHSSVLESRIGLVVSLRSGRTYAWQVEAATGALRPLDGLVPEAVEAGCGPVVSILALGTYGEVRKGDQQFLLVYAAPPETGEEAATVTGQHFPATSEPVGVGQYVHTLDEATGLFSTFHLNGALVGEAVATASFPAPLAAVAYPNAQDVVDSRFSVLGDSSILLEYINPHVVLVAYFVDTLGAAPAQDDDPASSSGISGNGTAAEVGPAEGASLYVALVDTVSARVVHRMLLNENAAGPVHALLVENQFVVTYWNAKAKRTELCSAALFEGMVDVFGLSPVTSFKASAQQQKDANLSAFSSPPPLGIQRTYIVPKAVTSLHHTTTSRGMAHKNVLVGTAGGQLYSLDYRFIHPRRPLATPTNTEKEEGLVQFNPYIHLVPQFALTQDERIFGDIARVATAPARLESTSLVLMYGGIDVFFTRTSPSQGFDVLASDFNKPLLIFLLAALAILVVVLRRLYVKKTLRMTWA